MHKTIPGPIAYGIIVGVIIALLILSATGCGAGNTHSSSEARATDRSPADVHQMPTGFRNFADKCDGHGHRVYVTSAGGESKYGSGIAVIADTSCPG